MKKLLRFCFGIYFYFLLPSMVFGLDKNLESGYCGISKKIYALSIESEYLNFVLSEEKKVEVRLRVPDLENLKQGDIIYLYDGLKRCAMLEVKEVNYYNSFDDLLAMEGVSNVIPNVSSEGKTGDEIIAEGVKVINSLPTYKNEVKRYGAIGIRLKYLSCFSEIPPGIIWIKDA